MGQIFCLLHEKVQAEMAKTPKPINERTLLLDTWELVIIKSMEIKICYLQTALEIRTRYNICEATVSKKAKKKTNL